jgi:CHASE2 domain-containing sensor protein
MPLEKQSFFKGKAVFIGAAKDLRQEQQDDFFTAFSHLSGVEIASTSFANLLADMPIRPLRWNIHLFLIFIWGLIVGLTSILFT